MTEHRAGEGASADGDHAHDLLKGLLRQVTEPVVNQIREFVPAFGGPDGGKRHQLMNTAATAAFRAFLAEPEDHDAEMRKVDELFRHLGWGEAQTEDAVENLEFAITIGSMATSKYLNAFGKTHGLPEAAVYEVIGRLFDYTDHLREELMEGYALGLRNPDRARRRLWTLLRRGAETEVGEPFDGPFDLTEIQNEAIIAGWSVPEEVVAIAIDDPALGVEFGRLPHTLPGREDGWHVLILAAEDAEMLLSDFTIRRSGATAVVSWPTTLNNAHAAVTWVVRGGTLVKRGIIPRTSVVRCSDQATQIWLHAEPMLREMLCQDVLGPLLAESFNSRTILSETLLTWLETRDSAPAIAARMGVHPQTIRYRWRRINELFGDSMQDPEFIVALTMLLKASVPMWQHGDHRDFQRYKEINALPDDIDEPEDPRLL